MSEGSLRSTDKSNSSKGDQDLSEDPQTLQQFPTPRACQFSHNF